MATGLRGGGCFVAAILLTACGADFDSGPRSTAHVNGRVQMSAGSDDGWLITVTTDFVTGFELTNSGQLVVTWDRNIAREDRPLMLAPFDGGILVQLYDQAWGVLDPETGAVREAPPNAHLDTSCGSRLFRRNDDRTSELLDAVTFMPVRVFDPAEGWASPHFGVLKERDTVARWNCDSGDVMWRRPVPHAAGEPRASGANDMILLSWRLEPRDDAYGAEPNLLRVLFNAEDGAELSRWTYTKAESLVAVTSGVAVVKGSADGPGLVVRGRNVDTAEPIWELPHRLISTFDEGRRLLTFEGRTLHVVDAATGAVSCSVDWGSRGTVTNQRVAVSQSGRWIALTTQSGELEVVDTRCGRAE